MLPGRRSRKTVVLAGVVVAISALVLMLLAPGAAIAHAALRDSSPGDGETVQEAPGELVLEFTGEIGRLGAVLQVDGPDGAVSEGDPEVEGVVVRQALSPDLPGGEYAVTWRVASADGHPISGEMSFTVAALEQPSPTSQDRGESAEPTDPSAVTAPTTTAPRAASTRSAGDPGSGGPPGWVWGVIAVAVLGLGGVAAVAYRSR
jgi:methionine-rich copper-binding protein CopC